MARRWPAMPHAGSTPGSHETALRAVREKTDIYERSTDDIPNSFTRVGELVDLGILKILGKTVQFDLTLAKLKDVDLEGIADGDTIVWDEARGLFVPGSSGGGGGSGVVETIVEGDGIDVDDTDPANPIVTNTGVLSVTGTAVDDTDPQNPVIDTTGGGGSANINPDTHPSSPDATDDEFEVTGSLDPKWTAYNGISFTDVAQGSLFFQATGAAYDAIGVYGQTAPSAPWRYRAKIGLFNPGGSSVDHRMGMITWVNGGPFRNVGCFSAGAPAPYVNHGTSLGAVATNDFASGTLSMNEGAGNRKAVYFEIENDATNLIFRCSEIGYENSFVTLFTVALATLTGPVDRIGLYQERSNANASRVICDWFRRMA